MEMNVKYVYKSEELFYSTKNKNEHILFGYRCKTKKINQIV
jgi:hypothetical protein